MKKSVDIIMIENIVGIRIYFYQQINIYSCLLEIIKSEQGNQKLAEERLLEMVEKIQLNNEFEIKKNTISDPDSLVSDKKEDDGEKEI